MSSSVPQASLDYLFIPHLQISLLSLSLGLLLNSPAWLRGNQLERYYWRTSAQAQGERGCLRVGWRTDWRTCEAVINSHVESGRFQGESQETHNRTGWRDSHMQFTLISLLERSTSKSQRKDTSQATCLLVVLAKPNITMLILRVWHLNPVGNSCTGYATDVIPWIGSLYMWYVIMIRLTFFDLVDNETRGKKTSHWLTLNTLSTAYQKKKTEEEEEEEI